MITSDDFGSMRFAPMTTRGAAMPSSLRDLSSTGLAFTLVGHAAETGRVTPEEGDMIKIEFTIPSRRQIACFATVVRVEERTDWDPELGDRTTTLVAVKFRNMPSLHRRTLELGLQGRTRDNTDFDWNRERRTHAVVITGLSLALALGFWFMVQPPHAWLTPIKALLGA
jgi:hypothetical protein